MNSKNNLTIAIDGGAASGKSSTSRALAEKFNLLHVDTGSHYRAVTLALIKNNISEDAKKVEDFLKDIPLSTKIYGQQATICINNKEPAPKELRSAEVNDKVSIYAAIPATRQFLFEYQRSQEKIAFENNFNGLVMEGRDIGSVIFPEATLRIFLEADPSTRAQRRAAEGQTDAVELRDKLDQARKTAPMKCPDGAIKIDTGNLTLEEVVNEISNMIESLQTKFSAR
jgi:CMP/dCMP kinase